VNAPITITFTGSPLGAAGAPVVTGAASVATGAMDSGVVAAGVVTGVVTGAADAGGDVAALSVLSSLPQAASNNAGTASSVIDLNAWPRTFMASPLSDWCLFTA
jgi:hypothetical protein